MKLIPNAQTWTATLDFLKTESLDTLTDKSLFYLFCICAKDCKTAD